MIRNIISTSQNSKKTKKNVHCLYPSLLPPYCLLSPSNLEIQASSEIYTETLYSSYATPMQRHNVSGNYVEDQRLSVYQKAKPAKT